MFKFLKNLKLFFLYRKNIKNNISYLNLKYGFEYNNFFELYTTIDLNDAPEDIKVDRKLLAENEIKKFISLINNDLVKLELEELLNVYEIKQLDNSGFLYGIAFGFSLMNNRRLYLIIISFLTAILGTLTTLLMV